MQTRDAGSTEIAQLVARAKKGDGAAFDALVERYASRVYNIALRITGSREEAEDCVQDAFLRAFSALRRFRGEAAFSTWLYRVAVNVANDATRRSKAQPLSASELTDLDAGEGNPELERLGRPVGPVDDGPERQALRSQRREVVIAAVRSLPEHHRTVVLLCDLQGLSYEEAAQVLQTRVGTVKSRLSRARLALKERLEPHLELLRE